MKNKTEISIVLPCLNEEKTIGICIKKAFLLFEKLNMSGEVIVCDNGSTDKSAEIAMRLGAKVVFVSERGYGNAYLKGLSRVEGNFIIMVDADDTYDILESDFLVGKLKEGYEFVIGSRFRGRILYGSMSWSHRFIGNPLLTGILNLFFKAKVSDAHSGFRAITKEALNRLELKTGGMEFASEMIVQALKAKLKITEVPITYYMRRGRSKLLPLEDAWRHFRFMLLYSPTYLFLIPGSLLFIVGFFCLLVFLPGRFSLFGHRFDIHAMVFASLFVILGFQIVSLGLYGKTYALLEGFEKGDKTLQRFYQIFNLEKGIALGFGLFIVGLVVFVYIIYKWAETGFGELSEARGALFALTVVIIGLQIVFSSFFLSMMHIQKRKD